MKTKTMKNILALCLCTLAFAPLKAQIDEKRMQRDLDISKNILSSLMEEGYGRVSERRIEASYVDGFGVIFKIPEGPIFFNYHFNIPEPMPVPEDVIGFKDERVIIYSHSSSEDHQINVDVDIQEEGELNEQAEQEMQEAEEAMQEAEKQQKRAEREFQKAREDIEKVRKEKMAFREHSHTFSDDDQNSEEREKELENAIITFLADYADLIGQLKPGDKIMVKKDSDNESFAMVWNGRSEEQIQNETGNGISITTVKKDITSYKANKLDKDEFIGKLDIKKGKKKEKIADLEIFANVFRQYFSTEYSKTFFITNQPDYERLDGMGVVFNTQAFASYDGDQIFYSPSKRPLAEDEKEQKEKMEALYPKFLSDLKLFIVDYGRTIRSLKENEKLVMKIELTKCDGCSTPNFTEATVPISVLMDFDQQKISREKAMTGVVIKELK